MPSHFKGNLQELRALSAHINLLRSADSIEQRTSAFLKEFDLTLCQFGVLDVLVHLGPLPQHVIAKKLLRSGGNITLVIDNLEKRELVRRDRHKDDRRTQIVSLSESGQQLIAQVFPLHVQRIVAEFSVLDAEEQELLRKFTRCIGKQTKEN